MNFTPELIAAAKTADSPEALIAMAKEQGVTLSDSEAALYFRQLHEGSGELSDDELDCVSGGGCGDRGDSTTYYYYGPNGKIFTPGCRVEHIRKGCWGFAGSLCNSSNGNLPRKLEGIFSYQNGGYRDWTVQCIYCNQFVYHGSRSPDEEGFR
ncbi:MAG: hypothetical protein IJC58_03605 [Oscillospiraceae bacterium]|nr:hypothetical protein [Oscillospiraceae bacterium]